MEAMAMAMAMSHSQPLLSQHSYSDPEDDDDGSSSSGELLRGHGGGVGGIVPSSGGGGLRKSSSSLRQRSYGDVARAAAGGGAPRGRKPRRHVNGGGGGYAGDPPRYVSFEDVIGGAALTGRDGSGWLLEAAIKDPLVRTASRLYARDDGTPRHRRQPSPGPLGTRRGSAMHGLVKRMQCFLAGMFCCMIPRY